MSNIGSGWQLDRAAQVSSDETTLSQAGIATRPSNLHVVSGNVLLVKFFGTTENDANVIDVIGVDPAGIPPGGDDTRATSWFATLITTVTATIGATAGHAGGMVGATDLWADTVVASAAGTQVTSYLFRGGTGALPMVYSPQGDLVGAYIVPDIQNYQYITFVHTDVGDGSNLVFKFADNSF